MDNAWHRIDQAYRPSTLAAHTTHFKTFLAYLIFMKLPLQISVHNVLTFLEYLYCRQISPAVLKNYVSSLRNMGTKFLLVVSPLNHFAIHRYLRSVSINSQFAPSPKLLLLLFGVLRHFQHCTGHIMTGSWKGRGNQYIEFARVVYCKLPTNGKQLPAFPLTTMTGIKPWPQRWEARVLPL